MYYKKLVMWGSGKLELMGSICSLITANTVIHTENGTLLK